MKNDRSLAWFKHGIRIDAKFQGNRNNYRVRNKITVFSYGENRRDHIDAVVKEAELYGYSDITIDHMRVYK